MKSATSFINPGILFNDFKRFTWISIAYFLGLILTVPLNLYLQYSRAERYGNHNLNYLLQFNFDSSPFELILITIIPVLTGLLLFRYLQNREAADMEHSLPIKRGTLYNTHVLAGLIFLFVPLIITALLSWAVISGLGIESLSSQEVIIWLATCMLLNLLFFMISVAAAMITGMSSIQGILSYIFLFLPTGLSVLLLYNLGLYIYGFAFDYYVNQVFISPLMRIFDYTEYPIRNPQIIIYLLITAILYFSGRYLYQQRKLEMAGNAIAFDILKPIFKYGVTFCSMLLVGSYYNIQLGMAWTYLGYFMGSILAYFLMEILLNKTFNVFRLKTLKGYGIFSFVVIILIAGLHFDFSGFEQRLPELAEVESIYLDNSFYSLNYREPQAPPDSTYYVYDTSYPPKQAIYTDQANIALIYALHQSIVNNLDKEKSVYHSGEIKQQDEFISLAYKLKDGTQMYRQYSLSGDYRSYLKPVYESAEYKRLNNKILELTPADINLVEVRAHEVAKLAQFSEPQDIKKAIHILQSEVIAESYEEMKDLREPWSYIEIRTNDHHTVNLAWKKSYADFEGWLKTTGKYNQCRIIPSQDLAYAMVRKTSADNKDACTAQRNLSQAEISAWEKMPDTIRISNPEQMEICLRKYTYKAQPDYNILFILKNGNSLYGGFAQANVPDFIKDRS